MSALSRINLLLNPLLGILLLNALLAALLTSVLSLALNSGMLFMPNAMNHREVKNFLPVLMKLHAISLVSQNLLGIR